MKNNLTFNCQIRILFLNQVSFLSSSSGFSILQNKHKVCPEALNFSWMRYYNPDKVQL